MFVQNWDSFAEQAEALYRADPIRTRYTLKYRHCDGKAVLKVTDDTVVSCLESTLFLLVVRELDCLSGAMC